MLKLWNGSCSETLGPREIRSGAAIKVVDDSVSATQATRPLSSVIDAAVLHHPFFVGVVAGQMYREIDRPDM